MSSWHDDSYPELRPGPPWVMEEMIQAQPSLAAGLATQLPAASELGSAIRAAAGRREPVVTTGCGTSEHAAQAVAALVDDALGGPAAVARQALDVAAAPWPRGVCVGISHEGETAATIAALAAARRAGATTALVTAAPAARASRHADVVLDTPLTDRSWCHTVGYVSPLLAGGLLHAALREAPFDPAPIERLLTDQQAVRPDAAALAGGERLLAAGADADAITARELALKVAEGARLPTAAYTLENVLHGHLVGHDDRSALAVVATGSLEDTATRRAAQVVAAARRIGVSTAAIASREAATALDVDVSVPIDPPEDVPPLLARLLGGAVALQLLTVALVLRRGVNPDLLRREEAPYREAAALGEKKVAAVFLEGLD